MTTLKTHGSSVEQDLGTVSEGEGAVAKVFTVLLIFLDLGGLTGLLGGALKKITDDAVGLVGLLGEGEGDVRSESGFPLGELEVASVDESGSKLGNVDNKRAVVEDGRGRLGLVEAGDKGLGERSGLLDAERRAVGAVALNLGDFLDGLDGLVDDATGFGVSNLTLKLDEARKNLRKERSDGVFVVDQFCH